MQDNKIEPIKVLIIDDSAFTRQAINRILEKAPNIKIIGTAIDGYDGMTKLTKLTPDIVTLDLEMPRMDGFSLLRWIMENKPLPVIMISSYGDAATVFKALELGAVDFVVKPTSSRSIGTGELKELEDSLLSKVLNVKSFDLEKHKKTISRLGDTKPAVSSNLFKYSKDIELVAIGASTGGPTAIQTILTQLPKNFPIGVIISQHMPRGFTNQFAERLNSIAEIRVKEAEHGELIEEGKVLICPGGHHMILESLKDKVKVNIKNHSDSDKYIPSVDIMMKSAAETYERKAMGIVLTGMGNDGRDGMLEIKNKGGYTIAESEESSVVFSMPQAVISAGAADKVLPLEEISNEIIKKVKKE